MRVDEKEWQADHDLHTLIEAEKIRRDKSRMQAVKKKAKQKLSEQALQTVEIAKYANGDE